MDDLIICDMCGTAYDSYEKVCPQCGRINNESELS